MHKSYKNPILPCSSPAHWLAALITMTQYTQSWQIYSILSCRPTLLGPFTCIFMCMVNSTTLTSEGTTTPHVGFQMERQRTSVLHWLALSHYCCIALQLRDYTYYSHLYGCQVHPKSILDSGIPPVQLIKMRAGHYHSKNKNTFRKVLHLVLGIFVIHSGIQSYIY